MNPKRQPVAPERVRQSSNWGYRTAGHPNCRHVTEDSRDLLHRFPGRGAQPLTRRSSVRHPSDDTQSQAWMCHAISRAGHRQKQASLPLLMLKAEPKSMGSECVLIHFFVMALLPNVQTRPVNTSVYTHKSDQTHPDAPPTQG